MNAEFGVWFLCVALMCAALQSSYLIPFFRRSTEKILVGTCWMQAMMATLALVTLALLRLDNDFSVSNVVAHSNLSLPTLYKIAGTWGNHEGSMLLWAWVLALFGLLLGISRTDEHLKRLALAVQALVSVGIWLFILLTSNPFARNFPPTADGQALNPILQDIALSIHPPLLYLGYVGFSLVFSLAVAALLQGGLQREWARCAHPWILAAWSALTLGIGLGSWWAYRELGWGGWWFWDPVENASLMPWLAGTALLHSNIVLKKRGALGQWVILLSIVTFALSLLGTFLVRSGALTSVHSFASDPARGLFILAYMAVLIGGALVLFAWRGQTVASREAVLPVSREGMIVVNNLFVLTACATVVLGTLYPLLAEWASGSKLTVGPPYFNMTFLPMMAAPLLFAGLVPFMAWKQAGFVRSLARARPAMLASAAAMLLVAAYVESHTVFALLGFGLAAWLGAASLQWVMTYKRSKGALAVFFGHMGAALLVAGITGAGLYKQELERQVAVGDVLSFAGYSVSYAGESTADAANYSARRAELIMRDDANEIARLYPEFRRYAIRDMATSESDIHSGALYDMVAVLGEMSADGKRTAIRLYYVPMIGFIWAGCVLIALGGIMGIRQKYDSIAI